MGFWDFFKGNDNKGARVGEKPPQIRKEVVRWADKAADKRGQNYDRQEALVALADLCQPLSNEDELKKTDKGKIQVEEHRATQGDASAALLRRFNFIIDPTITDQEEKQLAFDGILGAGKLALPGVRKYAAKAESVAWPIRIMKAMLGEEAMVNELLKMLEKWDTEYAKFVDPKLQLLSELEEHRDSRIFEAVTGFLMDVNETARFHAVGCSFSQEDDAAIDPLVEMFCDEESLRIRNRVCEGFLARGWVVPEARRAEMRKSLPSEFSIDGEGLLKKRG
ncbi:hypothetical protein BH09MYX1_BH09MYX1_60670 [soil metagenome]